MYIVRASAWENELIAKIKAILDIKEGEQAKAVISIYPNNPDSYIMKHQSAEILIRYTGTQYAKTGINTNIQESVVSMEIIFLFRNLRDAKGLYEIVQQVLEGLLGDSMENTLSPIWIESDELVGENNGIWQFLAKIKFLTLTLSTRGEGIKNDFELD